MRSSYAQAEDFSQASPTSQEASLSFAFGLTHQSHLHLDALSSYCSMVFPMRLSDVKILQESICFSQGYQKQSRK